MKRALLLNSDWYPLNFITEERAIRLLIKGRAEVVTNMDGLSSIWQDITFDSPSLRLNVPATLRLYNRIHRPGMRAPRFNRKVLFNRDKWRCQYCEERLHWDTASVDHVVPKSKGGGNSWLNCVTSCRPCNKRKANKTPAEAGMKLLSKPKTPLPIHFWDSGRSDAWHDDWAMFISK